MGSAMDLRLFISGLRGSLLVAHLPKPGEARGPHGSLGSNEPTNGGVPPKLDGLSHGNSYGFYHGTSFKKMDDLALPPWLGKPPCGHLLVNKHVAVEILLMDSKGHDWEIANSQILRENAHAFHVHGEYCLKCFFLTHLEIIINNALKTSTHIHMVVCCHTKHGFPWFSMDPDDPTQSCEPNLPTLDRPGVGSVFWLSA